jgi:hypothetical protein
MGRQIRFYTLTADEQNFVDFVLSLPDTQFINWKMDKPKIKVLDRAMIFDSKDVNLRHVFIWQKSLKISKDSINKHKAKIYSEERMEFIETGETFYTVSTDAPVIEFSRSFFREDNSLVQGRLWCDSYTVIDNNWVYKGDEFKRLNETLVVWIRKSFKKLKGVDGYFGPEALVWYQNGGQLFP